VGSGIREGVLVKILGTSTCDMMVRGHAKPLADIPGACGIVDGSMGPVMRGSVVVIGTRNKQPYFSLNKDKRTRPIYLGQKRVACARQYSKNYRRLLAIVEEMTILNMELLKRDSAP